MGEAAKRRIVSWMMRVGILFALIGLTLFIREFIPVNYSLFSSGNETQTYYKVVAVEDEGVFLNWQWLFLSGILFVISGLILRRIFKS